MRWLGLRLHAFEPDVAAAAEESGFDSLWFGDVALHDHTVLCALAAVTKTARLVAVTDIMRRNPAVVVKQATTLDLLSHGRAVLALGATDGLLLEEGVVLARRVFRDSHPTFRGRYFRADAALNVPGPVQDGGPPVLVRGHLDVAARHGDGVVLECGPAALHSELASLARSCGEPDRDPSTLMTVWMAPRTEAPAAVAEAASAAGIDGVVVDVGDITPEAVAAVAQEVQKGRREAQ